MGVVLVNWNRADFTIECLETLLRSTIPLSVVVVDNASSDNSVDRIAAWASGEAAYTVPEGALGPLSDPPLTKPVAATVIRANAPADRPRSNTVLTIIDAGANGGFAAGNNIGLRHLMAQPELECFWLLNNDTVVSDTAAAELLAAFDADPKCGMCGTVVRYYYRPDVIQVLNGYRFSTVSGRTEPIAGSASYPSPLTREQVAAQTGFIIGASLAVSRAFLDTIGLMSERYFLYFEEIDWAVRNKGRFAVGYADRAQVWHKEGGSIGSGGGKGARSVMSDYYLLRARLLFYREHFPQLVPVHWLLGAAQVALRLVRRQPDKARALVKALTGTPLR